jgi:hypothetical protein
MLSAWLQRCVPIALPALIACATEPPPTAQTITRQTTSLAVQAPRPKESLTKEQREALDAELGEGFSKALDGNFRRPNNPVAGLPRTLMKTSSDVDYASLPLMTEARIDSARDSSGFRLTETRTPSRDCSDGFGYKSWSLYGLDDLPKVVHVDRFLLPARVIGTNILTDSVDLTVLATLTSGRTTADWTTLDRRSTTAAVVRLDATYEPASRIATAKRKLTVEPLELINKALYAFRRCTAHCEESLTSPSREEEIELIGPPALWIGSNAGVDRQPLPQGQPFTDISVRISPSKSATLFLAVGREEMASFSDVSHPDAPDITTFSLDVVWTLGQSPEATLFVGEQHAREEDFARPPRPPLSPCFPL